MGTTKRYLLADEGQDLIHLDIDGGDIVGAGCTPMMQEIYVGQLNYDHYEGKTLKVGDCIRVSKSPDDDILTIKWPIVAIEEPA